jgi:hypothetical protein
LAGSLPRRIWPELQVHVPVAPAPAAFLAFFLGFAIGIPGFLDYAAGAGEAVSSAMLETGSREVAGSRPSGATTVVFRASVFSLFAFVLFTPTGLLSGYLVTSGLARLLGVAAGDPFGDPILTGLDAGWRAARESRGRRGMIAEREALEGPEVADVLVRGREAGAPTADYVVVASRLKPGWEPGATVMTGDGWFRLGEPFDRRFPGGLRRLYPLSRTAPTEVVRRGVEYTMPPLSTLDPVTRLVRRAEEPAPGD